MSHNRKDVSTVSIGSTESVSLTEAKAHIGIDASETGDDTYITARILSAARIVEMETNRALAANTYDYQMDFFEGDFILLPYYPLSSVTSVNSTDQDNSESEFSSSNYTADIISVPGRILLDFGQQWPIASLRDFSAVRIRYVAGLTNATETTKPPSPVRDFILQLVSNDYYVHRAGSANYDTSERKSIIRSMSNWQVPMA